MHNGPRHFSCVSAELAANPAFKISKDALFEQKLVNVVGLYLNPPARAALFSYEKTQCQALDRTQPSLPLKPGRPGTMTRHEP